jgi:uncharacterized protein YutE (UPF0331/DUF86 family)
MKHITDDYKQILINGFTNQLELLDAEDEKDWYERQVKFFSESLDAYAKKENADTEYKGYQEGLEAGKIIAKEGLFSDEERMFLEHAIRAWRKQAAKDTHEDWMKLSGSVMQKLK